MAYIGAEPVISATRTLTEIIATAGQTVFTANGGYTVGYVDVIRNGSQLNSTDYTATDGTTITLATAAFVNDEIKIIAYGTFNVSNLVAPNYTGTLTGGTGVVNLGSGQFYKDASGNVGIGTSSPNGRLNISQTGTSSWLTLTNTATTGDGSHTCNIGSFKPGVGYSNLLFDASKYTFKLIGTTDAMTLDSNGNLLVGITSFGSFGVTAGAGITSGRGLFTANANSPLAISRFTSVGNLVDMYYGSTYVASISTNGSTITYGGTSDYRLKENIKPLTSALFTVSQLKPCTFTWKNTGIEDNGFIAHELAEVCPNAVVGEKDAVNEDGSIKPQQVDTSFLVATLVAAIQELKAEIDALKGTK